MKLNDILKEESIDRGSIHNLVSIIGSLTSIINTAGGDYPTLYDEHQNNHVVKLILYARFSRWFTNNYLSSRQFRQNGIQSVLSSVSQIPSVRKSTKDQLKKISNLKVRGMVDKDGKRGTVDNFFNLARGLPKAIKDLGQDLSDERLSAASSYLEHALAGYDSAAQKAKKKPKSSKKQSKSVPKLPKDKSKGLQNTQSEQLINDVLSSIKSKDIRNDIRSKLSKRDNKLQLLQQLMKQYGLS